MATETSFYDLTPVDKAGQPYPFSQLKGKVVLIVNVASKCGFTPQYKGLKALDEKFRDDGLVILGFPCNQFMSQEPGLIEEISSFCQLNYGVHFQIMGKVDVNGPGEDDVYKFLKLKKRLLLWIRRIKWNFEKFLVDQEGNVVERYGSFTLPASLESEVAALLKKKENKKEKKETK